MMVVEEGAARYSVVLGKVSVVVHVVVVHA